MPEIFADRGGRCAAGFSHSAIKGTCRHGVKKVSRQNQLTDTDVSCEQVVSIMEDRL